MTEKRETVGKVATDLASQQAPTRSPIELEKAMHQKFEDNIYLAIERGKKELVASRDFYIVVITKKERLLQNVMREYFFPRSTCPTPDYDQVVYKYHASDDRLEFLWVIPSKQTCEYMREFALEVTELERDLLKFVLDFYDDTLMLLAKKLNNEELETAQLIQT